MINVKNRNLETQNPIQLLSEKEFYKEEYKVNLPRNDSDWNGLLIFCGGNWSVSV